MSDQIIREDLRGDAEIARLRLQAAHAEVERLGLTDAEGPMCFGFAADGVWLDTHYGWVIPDEASVADAGEAGPAIERDCTATGRR
jgi:hypothetical protein